MDVSIEMVFCKFNMKLNTCTFYSAKSYAYLCHMWLLLEQWADSCVSRSNTPEKKSDTFVV